MSKERGTDKVLRFGRRSGLNKLFISLKNGQLNKQEKLKKLTLKKSSESEISFQYSYFLRLCGIRRGQNLHVYYLYDLMLDLIFEERLIHSII